MKKIKLNGKLTLSKKAITRLNDLNAIKGGDPIETGYGMCIKNATLLCDYFSKVGHCESNPISLHCGS